MLTTIEKVIRLQDVDIFANVASGDLAYVAAIAEEVNIAAGAQIFAVGDAADAMYLVLEGRVRLHRDGEEIALADAGVAFGTWSLFDEEQRVVGATAVIESRLLCITREAFVDILADHGELAQAILRTLSRRLRNIVERVHWDRPAGN